MPPPRDGNEYLPFVDLFRLETIDSHTYRSIALPFCPGGDHPDAPGRAYGGHVYTQAAWAACQTVPEAFLMHNIVGHFLLSGLPTTPFVYTVTPIRNGRSYLTRTVNATQENHGICFTAIISFKTPETSPLSLQTPLNLWTKYAQILTAKTPADFDECPGMDTPAYRAERLHTGANDAFPGLQLTKPDMAPYNAPRHPLDRRQLMFYRPLGPLPLSNPNLHLCAHSYASDRNSLYVVGDHLDMGDLWTQMGSLVHSVVFHSAAESLLWTGAEGEGGDESPLAGKDGKGRWFAKEDWTDRAEGGRAMFHSRVWNSAGEHVATLMQEGMVRVSRKPEATEEEVGRLRERTGRWKPREKL